jgi:hypothetical protein
MRRKIAWLKSPVRHRTLAPFDGITRIRFKGSSNWTSQPWRLPRIVELRIRPDPGEVNEARRHDREAVNVMPAAELLTRNYPLAGACFTFV